MAVCKAGHWSNCCHCMVRNAERTWKNPCPQQPPAALTSTSLPCDYQIQNDHVPRQQKQPLVPASTVTYSADCDPWRPTATQIHLRHFARQTEWLHSRPKGVSQQTLVLGAGERLASLDIEPPKFWAPGRTARIDDFAMRLITYLSRQFSQLQPPNMCQPQMCSAARNAAAETYRTLRPWGQPVCKQQEKDTYVATTIRIHLFLPHIW